MESIVLKDDGQKRREEGPSNLERQRRNDESLPSFLTLPTFLGRPPGQEQSDSRDYPLFLRE